MIRETTAVGAAVMFLVLLGALMVYSTSALHVEGQSRAIMHVVYGVAGVCLMMAFARLDYHFFAQPWVYLGVLAGTLALLGLVLTPDVGVRVDGGQRWLRFAGFSLQPAEIAKFAMVLLLAVKLAANRDHITEFFRGVAPNIFIAMVFAVLVLAQRDIGIPVILVCAAFIMIYAAGARVKHLAVVGAFFLPFVALFLYMAPHRVSRLTAFINPWEHREDAGWQLIQSLWAFAQGSLLGQGAGAGEQKLGYLPAAHTDFIFAVIGEELGLVGTLSVVALFFVLTLASLRIAMHARDLFGSLLALGVTSLIGVQAALIMAVNMGMAPTKGLPLPFVSYGGSSLVMSLIMIGVLMNIGVQAREPESARKRPVGRGLRVAT